MDVTARHWTTGKEKAHIYMGLMVLLDLIG